MMASRLLMWGVALSLGVATGHSDAAGPAGWPTAGHDQRNSRHQSDEKAIRAKSVAGLRLLWQVPTDGDVTATPAVEGEYVYFPDTAGFLYKVDRRSGAVVWKRAVSGYTGIPGDFAVATPAIAGDALILGNQSGRLLEAFGQPPPQPARVFAVDKHTGNPLWVTQVDTTLMSFVSQSAVIANGSAIVGIASNEELVAGFVPRAFMNWQFRGSVVALDAATGAVRWKTYTVPDGYHGGAVDHGTGAVDPARGSVYLSTGHNFMLPQSALDCLNGGGTSGACLSADNHFDSILALDLATGSIRWATRTLAHDTWNVGCGMLLPGVFVPANDNCPVPAGPAWGFAQGPMLLGRGGAVKLVGAGQKNGAFLALAPDTGALAWSTQVAPGGVTGGLYMGSASDGRRVYAAVSNSGPANNGGGMGALPWTLKDGSTTTAGGWAALDGDTGAVVWTTRDPLGSRAEGAVSVAADVVFGCNMDAQRGSMYALDVATGTPLWRYDSGGACSAGPSIVDGVVFWGSGTGNGRGPKRIFAFGL